MKGLRVTPQLLDDIAAAVRWHRGESGGLLSNTPDVVVEQSEDGRRTDVYASPLGLVRIASFDRADAGAPWTRAA